MQKKEAKSVFVYFSYFIFTVTFILVGFYFGYKNAEAKFTNPELISNNKLNTTDSSSTNLAVIDPENDIEINTNVVWIKINQEPTCPPTHPIKGKFTNSANIYYTKDNNFYNRVVPHICFSTEEYAKEIAGFIKKF